MNMIKYSLLKNFIKGIVKEQLKESAQVSLRPGEQKQLEDIADSFLKGNRENIIDSIYEYLTKDAAINSLLLQQYDTTEGTAIVRRWANYYQEFINEFAQFAKTKTWTNQNNGGWEQIGRAHV